MTLILRRYLTKEVFSTSMVVMLFLLMMTVGNWLIRAFGNVVNGRIQYNMILELLFYQIPQLLEFIIPLAIFIGIMLSLSRQYVQQEVTIVKSAGLSPRCYAQLLIPYISIVFIIQAGVILYAKPAGLYATEQLKSERAIKTAFDLVQPKQFVSISRYSLYVGGFSEDKLALKDLVLIERGGANNGRDRVILATRAEQVKQDEDTKPAILSEQSDSLDIQPEDIITQLDLYQGRQYEIGTNNQSYNQISFDKYRLTIKVPRKDNPKDISLEAQSTVSLFHRASEIDALAELMYRFTVPFIILLALILALPLSEVAPRKSRWVKLIPAILLFATSVLVMNAVKGSIIKGKLPVLILPMILICYIGFGILLYQKESIHNKLKQMFAR